MTKLLKTAAIAALITGFANSASALEVTSPLDAPGFGIEKIHGEVIGDTIDKLPALTKNHLPAGATIGVARIDGGRLIPTPHGEVFDWDMLQRRTQANLEVMNAGHYLKYTPEVSAADPDSDNRIDEIRLTAANEGYSHVIIYGLGPDAYWASFGGKALRKTGLTVHVDCDSWDKARAKALLIDSFTGEVLGAAKADDVTYNIGYLADDVERLITQLSAT
jgi:hypothetical protein